MYTSIENCRWFTRQVVSNTVCTNSIHINIVHKHQKTDKSVGLTTGIKSEGYFFSSSNNRSKQTMLKLDWLLTIQAASLAICWALLDYTHNTNLRYIDGIVTIVLKIQCTHHILCTYVYTYTVQCCHTIQ